MEVPEIQPKLAKRLTDVHGDVGRQWIAGFPSLLARFCQQWEVAELGSTFGYVGYAWVAPVILADGSKAVLKLAPPDKEIHDAFPDVIRRQRAVNIKECANQRLVHRGRIVSQTRAFQIPAQFQWSSGIIPARQRYKLTLH